MPGKKRVTKGCIIIAAAVWTITQIPMPRESALINKNIPGNRTLLELSADYSNKTNEVEERGVFKIRGEGADSAHTGADDVLDAETEKHVNKEGKAVEEEGVDDKDKNEDVDSHPQVDRRLKDLGLHFRNYTFPGCHCARLGIDMGDLRRARAEAARRPERFPRWFLERFSFAGESTCSDFATQRGGRQKVLSFCYFINKGKTVPGTAMYRKYMQHAYGTAGDIKRIYPGWLMRIYHSVTAEDLRGTEELCRIYCDHPHVDLCLVHDLPGIGNLSSSGVVGRLWRYASMGDPAVEAFHCRDIDSYVLERDAAAVREWLESGKTYHAIHDHPGNIAVLMGGLWGGLNKDLQLMRRLRDTMFNRTAIVRKSLDQKLLRAIVWPEIKHDLLDHASYPCQHPELGPTAPLPTRRVGREYCGLSAFNPNLSLPILQTDCPVECRPKEHLDWIKC